MIRLLQCVTLFTNVPQLLTSRQIQNNILRENATPLQTLRNHSRNNPTAKWFHPQNCALIFAISGISPSAAATISKDWSTAVK